MGQDKTMLDYLRIRQYSTLLEYTSYPVWKNNVKKGKKLIVVLDLFFRSRSLREETTLSRTELRAVE